MTEDDTNVVGLAARERLIQYLRKAAAVPTLKVGELDNRHLSILGTTLSSSTSAQFIHNYCLFCALLNGWINQCVE
jgi:hypothetical protein